MRLVFKHQGDYASQWGAMSSIAQKIGCTTETLRKWVRQAERDTDSKPGFAGDEREGLKPLEREN